MNRDELEKKLDIAFAKNLGVDASSGFKNDIDVFKKKIALLANTDRYNKLIKKVISSKNIIEFNSFVFETYFAYDFESKDKPLEYEAKLLKNSGNTIDFLYKTKNEMTLCFELHQANQRRWLTDFTKAQLGNYGKYQIELEVEDEKARIIRLQNLILSKCQDENGNPRKFPQVVNIYNIIVIYVSGEIDGHIDKLECRFTMYGDSNLFGARWIFGLCEQSPENTPAKFATYYKKFKHFRETIHGVLFVKNVISPARQYRDLILDLDLEYYLIGNNNLVNDLQFNAIYSKLNGILKEWTE